MSESTQHTPTPWHQGPFYKNDIHSAYGQVATCHPLMSPLANANAAFIVTAVNAHDTLTAQVAELRASLEKFMGWLDDGTLVRDIAKDAQPDWAIKMMQFVIDLNNARAALASTEKAGG